MQQNDITLSYRKQFAADLARLIGCPVDELPATTTKEIAAAYLGLTNPKTLNVWKSVGHYGIVMVKVGRHSLPTTEWLIGLKVAGFQLIYSNGDKLNQPGCRMGGSYFLAGEITDTVVIAEGLATALSIEQSTGLPTAAAFYAGNLEAVAKYFHQLHPDASIIIAADNDIKPDGTNPGVTCAEKAAKAVTGDVVVPEHEGKACDFSDVLIQRGADAVATYFNELAEVSATPSAKDPFANLKTYTLDAYVTTSFPGEEMLMDPVMTRKSITLTYGGTGVGKSFLEMSKVLALASGGTFADWKATGKYKILYVDGEMPTGAMQDRFRKLIKAMSIPDDALKNITFLSSDQQEYGVLPDLATHEGQQYYAPFIQAHDVVVFDNRSCLCRSGRENDGDDERQLQEFSLYWRSQNKAIEFLHHAGKNGMQRGNSKKTDTVDTIIQLRHSSDYQKSDGAKFEVHFDKNRHFYGDQAKPFIAHLKEDPLNVFKWEFTPLDTNSFEKVKALNAEGMSAKEIASELEMSLSQVYRHIKSIKQEAPASDTELL